MDKPVNFDQDKSKYIAWAYRLLLGREPESEAVIQQMSQHRSSEQLVGIFLNSAEFRARYSSFGRQLVDRWTMIECSLGFDLWVNLADTDVSWPIIEDDFEKAEVEFVRRHVTPGMTVLDIGANIGFFSMLLSSLVGSNGRVVGFEPMPLMHSFAMRSARANGFDQCLIHNLALSDSEGTILLLDNPAAPNSTSAYISDQSAPGHKATTVPTRLLGDIHPDKVDFIKIDVEGAEYLALKPYLSKIAQHKPVILSEISPYNLRRVSKVSADQYTSMFTDLGYRCIDLATGDSFSESSMIGSLTNVSFLP